MLEWHLDDVEQQNRQYPDSFFIPSEAVRTNQAIGDLVQLHFVLDTPTPSEDAPRAERMWVEVTENKDGGGAYIGVLTNEPMYIQGLHAGDPITFEAKHIARILIRQEDPNWLSIGEKKALVSKKCFENGFTVRWIYRESADREEDSGWRVFEGTESEDELNDASIIQIVNIYYLCDKDPTLIAPFRADFGSAFERESPDSPWVEIHDFELHTD